MRYRPSATRRRTQKGRSAEVDGWSADLEQLKEKLQKAMDDQVHQVDPASRRRFSVDGSKTPEPPQEHHRPRGTGLVQSHREIEAGARSVHRRAGARECSVQANEKLYLNGIDAETGQYLIPPIAIEDAGAMLKGTDPTTQRRASADRTRGTSSRSGRSQLAASDLAGVEPAASRLAARSRSGDRGTVRLGDRVSCRRIRRRQASARAADRPSPYTRRSGSMQGAGVPRRRGPRPVARAAWIERRKRRSVEGPVLRAAGRWAQTVSVSVLPSARRRVCSRLP